MTDQQSTLQPIADMDRVAMCNELERRRPRVPVDICTAKQLAVMLRVAREEDGE